MTWEEEGVACFGSWTVLQHKQLQLVQQLLLVHKSQQRTVGHVLLLLLLLLVFGGYPGSGSGWRLRV